MMKYKAGDKVRLKKGLKYGVDYGDAYYIEEMDKYLGKELEITKIFECGRSYEFKCNDEESFWLLTDEMIEDATLRLIDILNMISRGEFEKGRKIKFLSDGEVYTFDDDAIDLVDSNGFGIFQNCALSSINIEVEIIKPEEEKKSSEEEKESSEEIERLSLQITSPDGDYLNRTALYAIIAKINELASRFNSLYKEVKNK